MSSVKRVQMSLIGIDEERAYSADAVWAFYKIPSTPYEFMDYEGRVQLARKIDVGLASLVTNATKSVECQLIVTSAPLNVEAWASQWRSVVTDWGPREGFEEYTAQMANYLDHADFHVKEVYLGVMLGTRSLGAGKEEAKGTLKGSFQTLTNIMDGILGSSDYQISDAERKHWLDKGREVSRILRQGNLAAIPATPEEIAVLFKRPLYPAMPSPTVDTEERTTWGEGELATLRESYIEKGRKFLKIVQTDDYGQEMVGYRATLCFSHFPDVLHFPEQEPWIHYAGLLGLNFDMYSRFTLEPAQKVRKQVEKKIAEINDEAKNATGAGGALPLGIQERLVEATLLENDLSRDAEPWVFARHRLVVTAPTEEELRDRVQAVISHYADMQIKLAWPTGDQMQLLLEQQPADKVRVGAYMQRQTLSIISGGMPTAHSSVGDRRAEGRGWLGPYIGSTTSRVREPVFFSPHVAPARHSPPGVLITGSPGGGKSFTAFTIACQMSIAGVSTIYIDPKADALPIQNLKGIGKVNVFDLKNGAKGILDPFALGTTEGEKILLAIESINMMTGGTAQSHSSILAPIVTEVAASAKPSLNAVVERLIESDIPEARDLGSTLGLLRRIPFSELCFSPQEVVNISPEDGLTIITLLGLDLPLAETPPSDYTLPNRLAATVMYLLTSFTRQLLVDMDKSVPKAVCIDEAWAVASTQSGSKVIEEIARMGRSHNIAIILVSQNAQDFAKGTIENSVSTKFAFRAKSKREVEGVLGLLDLENDPSNREFVQTLNNGECLMQDVDGRIARVQIDAWNEEWRRAFDTNPHTRGKALAAAQSA